MTLSTPKIQGILNDRIEEVWDQVTPLISNALRYSYQEYDLEDIKQGLLDRDMQLWVAFREDMITTCMITRILKFPKAKHLVILIYSGEDVKRMLPFKEKLYEWAKGQGCTSVQLYGRPGWERVLAKEGYEKIYTVLRAKL